MCIFLVSNRENIHTVNTVAFSFHFIVPVSLEQESRGRSESCISAVTNSAKPRRSSTELCPLRKAEKTRFRNLQ